jgi:hypothetical protein
MTTVRDIITRAFRKIGVTANDEELTADQAVTGLNALNAMMHAWTLRVRTWAHIDVALADDFPMPASFHEGVVYMLASEVAPDYSVASFSAEEWFRRFATYYHNIPTTKTDAEGIRSSVQRFNRVP